MNRKVLVAMSGGVDSSIACYLLKKKGYTTIGATIKTWPKDDCKDSSSKLCCSLDAISYARQVANKLNIPHYVFDFSNEFKKIIKDYFIQEYMRGRTPNPCVYCNSEIKFGLLLKRALQLGCDFISTGHYARVEKNKKLYLLKKAKDKKKDQSYFLFNLKQHQLRHILFPLGDMTKENVKKKAKELGFKSHDRPSSQDICFNLEDNNDLKGDVIFRESVIGEHKGISNYTVGQRKGLGIAYAEPLYITKIDHPRNEIHLGVKKDTYKKILIADNLNWIEDIRPKMPLRINAKIRYGTKEAPSMVRAISRQKIQVEFDRPQFSPTPGQAIVFYRRDKVLGGGWIKEIVD